MTAIDKLRQQFPYTTWKYTPNHGRWENTDGWYVYVTCNLVSDDRVSADFRRSDTLEVVVL